MILGERIGQYDQRRTSKIDVESIDILITRFLNQSRKVQGRGKGVPYSREKLLCWLAYWKLRKKLCLSQAISKESVASKKRIARVVDSTRTIDVKPQEKWIVIKKEDIKLGNIICLILGLLKWLGTK